MWCNKTNIGILLLFLAATGILGAFDIVLDNTSVLSTDNVPLWVHAHNWGALEEKGSQNNLGLKVYHSAGFGDSFTLQTVADGLVRLNQTNEALDFFLRQAYVDATWYFMSLRGGIFHKTLGILPVPGLSTGSMSVSENAVPLPKVRLASDGFISVPYTNENLWVKGGLSHGWFTDSRKVTGALLHEKWAYAKLQREDILSLHLGLVHQVLWGGDDDRALPATWENYWRVFFSRSGGADANVSDQINRAGDTLGIWDIGMDIGFDTFTLHFYKHHFFEDGSGFWRFRNFQDGLWGTAVTAKESGVVDSVVFEILHTKHQSGPLHDAIKDGEKIGLGGRDSYYSHSTYSSGWTHHGSIIGTPLFLTSGDGETLRIASNRVIALHLGLGGTLTWRLSYNAKNTFALHFEPYTAGDAEKVVTEEDEPLVQWHQYVEFIYQDIFNIENSTLLVGIGLDHGDIFSLSSAVKTAFSITY